MSVQNSLDFGRARRAMDRAIPPALHDAADIVLDESNRRVPKLTGDLEASGSVIDEGDLVGVRYTDIAAVPQHENLDYHHDNGEAKFLERAATSTKDQQAEAIAGRIRTGLR